MLESIHRQIQQHLHRRDYDRAGELIDQRLKTANDDAEAYYLRGVYHYFQGRLKPTIESLRKALEINPQHTDAAICLSVLLNDIGKYEEAKGVFQSANRSVSRSGDGHSMSVDRKFAIKHLELADMYFRYRRYDEAIEEYGRAILLDPENLELRIRRAKAYAKKGFISRAFQDLQAVRSDYPTYAPARMQLGLLHYSQNNLLDAELEWEEALKIDPKNKEIRNYLDLAKKARQGT